MMKVIIISILICSFSFANQSRIGIGSIISQSEYKGTQKNKIQVIPVANLQAGDFYLKGIEFGYKAIDKKKFSLSYILQPRFQSYDSSDSIYLKGMNDRKPTVEAGVKVTARPIFFLNVQLKALYDTLKVHDGYVVDFKVSTMFRINKKTLLFPFISKTYMDKNYMNYYYGVKNNEATLSRNFYKPNSAFKNTIGMNLIHIITKKISTNIILSQTYFGNEITNSPIVDSNKKRSVIVGMSYKF